jgi:hypothetical protein
MGSAGPHRLRADLVPDQLRVDATLPDAPRDQLRVLAAEVDDEDGTLLRCGLWQRNNFSGADSSAPPS